jgi:hypothetical protein
MKCKTKDCNNQTCTVLGIETLYCNPCYDHQENCATMGLCADCGDEIHSGWDNGVMFLTCPTCDAGKNVGGQDPFSPTLHD